MLRLSFLWVLIGPPIHSAGCADTYKGVRGGQGVQDLLWMINGNGQGVSIVQRRGSGADRDTRKALVVCAKDACQRESIHPAWKYTIR